VPARRLKRASGVAGKYATRLGTDVRPGKLRRIPFDSLSSRGLRSYLSENQNREK
jgi:hypothetical protein